MIVSVLKIIGIIFLVIVCLIIFILGVILFTPVRYQFEGSYDRIPDGNACVKWTPILLRASMSYHEGELKYIVRMFGGVVMTNTDAKISWIGRKFFSFREEGTNSEESMQEEDSFIDSGHNIVESEKKKDYTEKVQENPKKEKYYIEKIQENSEKEKHYIEKVQVDSEKEEGNTGKVWEKSETEQGYEKIEQDDTVGMQEHTQTAGVSEKNRKKDIADSDIDTKESGDTSKEHTGYQRRNRKYQNRSKDSLFDKMRDKIDALKKVWSNCLAKLKKMNEKKNDLLQVYHSKRFESAKKDVLAYIKEIFRIIKPDKLEGRICFGLEDPAATGQLLGILAMGFALYYRFLEIHPDFSGRRLEADLKGKGKIVIFLIVKLAIRVKSNKNLIKVTKKVQTILEA